MKQLNISILKEKCFYCLSQECQEDCIKALDKQDRREFRRALIKNSISDVDRLINHWVRFHYLMNRITYQKPDLDLGALTLGDTTGFSGDLFRDDMDF